MKLLAPLLALLAAASAASCHGGGAPHGTRKNLILISLDTCRADRLSCYGAERENTPFLDALAARSVQFRDCLAQSALTAPSHMSILTGQFVHRHGLLNNQGSTVPKYTLASLLAGAGWRTAAFTGHGSFQAKHGLSAGFETFQSSAGDLSDHLTRDLRDVAPHALRWLDGELEEHPGEPFFLLVHSYDPHCPFWPPEPYRSEYAGWYDGPFAPELQDLCHPKRFRERMQDGAIGTRELRYINDMYDAGIAASDAALGAFLQQLDERGVLEDSIVVFTSDHGEVLGNHGWVGHGQVWEEALRVPLLVRFPGPEGAALARTLDDPVQHVDLAPTLLDALGVRPPPGLQGTDLMPLVRGELAALPGDRMRIARVGEENNQVSVRFGPRWKAMFNERADGRYSQGRLFDLENDPFEQQDVSGVPAVQDHFEDILRRYFAWRAETRAEDERLGGTPGEPLESPEDLEMLRKLGYADGVDGG